MGLPRWVTWAGVRDLLLLLGALGTLRASCSEPCRARSPWQLCHREQEEEREVTKMNKAKSLMSFCPTSINRTNAFGFSFISSQGDPCVLMPIAEMAKMAPRSSSHSCAITALGGGRRDFPRSGKCSHGEAKCRRVQLRLPAPLGEGAEAPGTARQWSWGWVLAHGCAPQLEDAESGEAGENLRPVLHLGARQAGCHQLGELPAADPMAR